MPDSFILPLDIPTLAISRGLMQMMLGGLLIYVGNQQAQQQASRLWALGFLLNGLSLFVFAIEVPTAWERTTVIINHLALGASSAFFLFGFWQFGSQRSRPGLAALMLILPLASLLMWEVIWPNARLRVLVTATGQALFLLLLQHSLSHAPRKELATIYKRLRMIVLGYLVVFVWSYASIAGILPTSAHLELSYHRTAFSVASLLFMLALAFACLALQFALLAARNADLAMTDWLTGLLNRRGFFMATRQLEDSRGAAAPLASVIVIDIDQFKMINDRFGHANGDHVLKSVADKLRELADEQHLLARTGGEEFCVVMPNCDQHKAMVLAESIRRHCQEAAITSVDGQPVRLTISAGVCEVQGGQSFDQAMIFADKALYQAKRAGRNQVQPCTNAAARTADRMGRA